MRKFMILRSELAKKKRYPMTLWIFGNNCWNILVWKKGCSPDLGGQGCMRFPKINWKKGYPCVLIFYYFFRQKRGSGSCTGILWPRPWCTRLCFGPGRAIWPTDSPRPTHFDRLGSAVTAVTTDADDADDFTTTVQREGSLLMMIDPITGR